MADIHPETTKAFQDSTNMVDFTFDMDYDSMFHNTFELPDNSEMVTTFGGDKVSAALEQAVPTTPQSGQCSCANANLVVELFRRVLALEGSMLGLTRPDRLAGRLTFLEMDNHRRDVKILAIEGRQSRQAERIESLSKWQHDLAAIKDKIKAQTFC